jgi:hypothetical protein
MPSPNWFHPIDFADVQRLRGVSLAARWVFVETFCGELGSKTGLVPCRPVLIADEAGMTVREVEEALAELHAAGIIVWCPTERAAYHAGSIARHPPTNPKHRKGWEREVGQFQDSPAKSRAFGELGGYAEPIESLPIAYREPIVQEQEQEQERERDTGSLTLTPPAPKKQTKAARRKKAVTDDEMAEAADRCPSEQDAVDHAFSLGLAKGQRWWAEAWWSRWEERRWIKTDRSGNRQPVGNWKMTMRTAWKYAVAEKPALQHGHGGDFTSRWTVQPGQDPDPWGGCRE